MGFASLATAAEQQTEPHACSALQSLWRRKRRWILAAIGFTDPDPLIRNLLADERTNMTTMTARKPANVLVVDDDPAYSVLSLTTWRTAIYRSP